MKTLILSLMMVMSQASFAGGSQVGTLDNSSVGNFKSADNGSVGTMGTGKGNMDNSSVGNFLIAGGAEANAGGGVQPELHTPNSGHEV